MHSSLYSNGGGSILVLLFSGLLSFFKLSSTIVVLVSWICRKVRGVKNTIFGIHLVFSPRKNEKGSYDELESDASQGFCDRIIVSAFSGNFLLFCFFGFLLCTDFRRRRSLLFFCAGSVILYMICSG